MRGRGKGGACHQLRCDLQHVLHVQRVVLAVRDANEADGVACEQTHESQPNAADFTHGEPTPGHLLHAHAHAHAHMHTCTPMFSHAQREGERERESGLTHLHRF